MWQIRQLEAFHAILTHGSITRAAKNLHISQPAVSKLLASLERHCGFKLFLRQGSRLTITSEGELLFGEVQRMNLGTEEIRRKAVQIREKHFGTLNVAAFPALGARALPTIVSGFMKQHPHVKPLLTSRSSQFLIDWVCAQKSDFGIGLLTQERPGLEFRRLMQVNGVCALPPSHRLCALETISSRDLDGEPFIAMSTVDGVHFLVDAFFRGHEPHRNIVVEAQMSEAACQFVADGVGVSIVEPFSTFGFSQHEIVVKPISPALYFDVWLMFPTYRPMSLIARSFAFYLQAELQRMLTEHGFEYVSYELDVPQ